MHSTNSLSFAQRWNYALKPGSWPKLLVPTVLGHSIGIAITGDVNLAALLLGLFITLAHGTYVVLLNDWGDQHVDALKRQMFPQGGSAKTIPDGILPAPHLLYTGLAAALLTLIGAAVGMFWLNRPLMVLIGALGVLTFFAYTLPPIRLNYRGGGELLEMIGVGVILPYGQMYLQSGVFWHPLLALLGGYTMLCLCSALASGLSDEESDRAGGKVTFVTLWGNARVRTLIEGGLIVALAAWCVALVWVPLWIILPACAVVLLEYRQVRQLSAAALTNAFSEQKRYKQALHRAIWYSTITVALLLFITAFWS